MAPDLNTLVQQYEGYDKIPSELLYDYLQGNREDLINEAKLGVTRIPESKLGKEVRRRCKADLFWMARWFTWITNPISEGGFKPFEENIFDEQYYRVVSDLFVAKDDSKSITDQSEIKTRMLLWPRGGAKSTFDHVDTVQWILNFPAIRILYLTATVDLAEGFVGEIKGHFYFKEDPSWMNLFFPEFCIEEGKSGAMNTFTCPVYAAKKTGRKESTVIASSVGKAKAGWRYELIKADDAVSDTNSVTSEQCTKISGSLFLAEKVLALGGNYIDYIGTRYAEEDHYGVIFEQNIGDNIIKTEGQGWVQYINPDTLTKILVGKAIQIKPEVALRLEQQGKPVTYQEAGPEGCIFLLPQKLMSFSWLMGDMTKDEKSFEGQRNQNPRPASQVEFTRSLLLSCTIPYFEMPNVGAVTQVWDFAFSQKKGRDYSTGVSIMWAEQDEVDQSGKRTGQKITVGYVQEIVRDRFNHITLAQAVVGLAERHRPMVIGVENVGGSSYLTEQIKTEAIRKRDVQLIQTCSAIDWFSPDNQKDAKKVRMRSLYPMLVQGRLKFAAYCTNDRFKIEVVYSEFEKCLTSHHHDDIPDVIAMSTRYQPRAYLAIVQNNEEQLSRTGAEWNIIFENGDQFGRAGGFMPDPMLSLDPADEDNQEDGEPLQYFNF